MATRLKRNWKKAKDYEAMKKFNSLQWAWEFLRRNPEYIKKWKEVVRRWPDVVHDFTLGPSATIWGLEGYFNPDKDHPPRFEGLGEVKLGGRIDNSEARILQGPLYDQEGIVKCSFDLNHPVIPQLKLVKKILFNFQKSLRKKGNEIRTSFKPQVNKWTMLIRILDAIAADAKDKEIAEVLFPPECPVDKKADKCPLDEGIDLDEKAASKCPLGERASGKCALEDPAAGIKKVGDKRKQALKYAKGDYKLILYSGI